MVLGSFVIANYITMKTDSKTSIHRGKAQTMLFVMLRQEVRHKMPVALRRDTANDCNDIARQLTAQLQSQPGN